MTDLLATEFDDVDLGDARLVSRAARILTDWSKAPAASFPKVAGGSAELQGLYGFMENETVDYRELIDAHAAKTCLRIDEGAGRQTVLVVHDTTTFTFPGEVHREGMGWLGPSKQGFHGHFSLALSADGSRCPLGVIGLSIDMPLRRETDGSKRKKRTGRQCAADPDRDTRWRDAVDETSAQLRGHAVPIHVMDREADAYELFATMLAQQQRFVVRARVLDRPVTTAQDGFVSQTKLRVVAERAVPVTAREVQLSRRNASRLADANKKHPPRLARTAKLEFAAERVRLRRTKYLKDPIAKTIDVNVVHVREVDTPPGLDPVEWLLVTSEPIDTIDDILRIVDHYRARWTIEEFFKAIKTGCNYERRQLESAHAMLIALGVCVPIAWQMLVLRHQSRHQPDRRATDVIDPGRLEVLTAISRTPIPASATVEQVLYAIAALGGHIRRNGPPGWQTLRDGMERLLLAEQGWNARAAAVGRCGQ